MKKSRLFAALCLLVCCRLAGATVIFDSITGLTAAGSYSIGGDDLTPNGDSFAVASPSIITSVTFNLDTSSRTDGGYVLAYLVPDVAGLPSSNGRLLTNTTFLGTIADSTLLSDGTAMPSLTTSVAVAAGTYWIMLVGSDNTANGGDGTTTSATWVAERFEDSGVGMAGQHTAFYGQSTDSYVIFPDATSAFRMIVTADAVPASVPEPSGLAMLGAGLVFLGLARRRASAG